MTSAPPSHDRRIWRTELQIILSTLSDLPALFNCMASSSSGDFDLFDALCSQPDLLELVVQQCSGNKNSLRLACSRLRAAVDACVTGLAWHGKSGTSAFFSDFKKGAKGDKNLAVLARCPRLQKVDFSWRRVADLAPLAACIGLRRVTGICLRDSLPPFAALTRLEHLNCSQSGRLQDISALSACTALKYLDCSLSGIKQLPPLPASLETLICHSSPLADISALAACTALRQLNCCRCSIAIIPRLPVSLETLNISRNRCIELLSPLAECVGLRSLDCRHTPVRDLAPLAACAALCSLDCRYTGVVDLMPMLACKRLELLKCSDFCGVNDQASQLRQAHPDLLVRVEDGYAGVEEEEEGEDDGVGYGWDGMSDYDGLKYEEMEGHGWADNGDGGVNDGDESTE